MARILVATIMLFFSSFVSYGQTPTLIPPSDKKFPSEKKFNSAISTELSGFALRSWTSKFSRNGSSEWWRLYLARRMLVSMLL